jgi:uncharacterized protein
MTPYSQLMQTLFETDAQLRVIQDKQRFLEHYPAFSALRGKGLDYSDITSPHNLTGYQQRVYGLLGFKPVKKRFLAGHRIGIKQKKSEVDVDKILYYFVIEPIIEIKNDIKFDIFTSQSCENRQDIENLIDAIFEIGSHRGNYKLNAAQTHYELFQKCGDAQDFKDPNRILGTVVKKALNVVIKYFIKYGNSEGFHVIEHILLRQRIGNEPLMPIQGSNSDCCPEVMDPYSFRVSVYLPSWSRRFKKIGFRQWVEKVLQEECPAHIFPKICWINHYQMVQMENKLELWQKALQNLPVKPCNPVEVAAMEPKDDTYSTVLGDLIEFMHEVDNVFPTARLHDCQSVNGENPVISLDYTSLGTL